MHAVGVVSGPTAGFVSEPSLKSSIRDRCGKVKALHCGPVSFQTIRSIVLPTVFLQVDRVYRLYRLISWGREGLGNEQPSQPQWGCATPITSGQNG
jgi:hypothetical protein